MREVRSIFTLVHRVMAIQAIIMAQDTIRITEVIIIVLTTIDHTIDITAITDLIATVEVDTTEVEVVGITEVVRNR